MSGFSTDKKKKIATLGASSLLLVTMVVAVTFGMRSTTTTHGGSAPPSEGEPKIATSNKAIEAICQPTHHREACINTLTSAGENVTDPKELVKIAFRVTKEEIASALNKSATIRAAANDPRAAQGLEICREVVEYSVHDLQRSVDSLAEFGAGRLAQFVEDLKVWVGGAITYQEVCFDAFENTTSDAGEKMRELLKTSRQLTENALTIITQATSILTQLDIQGLNLDFSRRLLSVPQAGELPAWLNDKRRHILQLPTAAIEPDVVVALDGSGKLKSIQQALHLVPKNNDKAFVIYIKAGVYHENVVVNKKMTNVVFIGDGPTKTKITGHKSFVDGIPTFKTATVDVIGDGFMAKDIGFENSAGATKHQAVALRAVADFSVFYNCQFDGYQDTLYAVRSRQFYRDCTISGTIDFIFGDALAIFQNCKMVIRKPLDNQQCMVTAQGRTVPDGPGAIILQNCTITADPAYSPVKTINKAFLGRPWKQYSRTIVVQSFIDDAIAAEGWTPWAGTFGLDTLFYSEYENRGPGAAQAKRVNWAGVKRLTPQQVEEFTPGKFYTSADAWIQSTGCPYYSDMVPQ
ncbi:hypothetical protein Nepgr_031151 [Nepenthes gracilis]|uniref:Pectinesterase n=1 Tax=Nepenthes gracilis TaxID=150966 RepID=A0AAD3Y4W5_NEPGR|nr:hypothetical protein Nepgr_031151 [Nepenthes gracilis]